MVHGDNVTIDTNLVEDKYKTGTGEVLRLGQKIKTKTATNISHGPSGCTALAGSFLPQGSKNRPPSGHLRLKNPVWRVKKSF